MLNLVNLRLFTSVSVYLKAFWRGFEEEMKSFSGEVHHKGRAFLATLTSSEGLASQMVSMNLWWTFDDFPLIFHWICHLLYSTIFSYIILWYCFIYYYFIIWLNDMFSILRISSLFLFFSRSAQGLFEVRRRALGAGGRPERLLRAALHLRYLTIWDSTI